MITPVSVGIMAFNEEKNIGVLLKSLLKHRSEKSTIEEIIVVSSGSTDLTNHIVKQQAKKDKRIKLIVEQRRKGKASAVNIFIAKAKRNILVLISADVAIEPTTLDNLVIPFKNHSVGITGAHPIPINDPTTCMGFAAHLLWRLHHEVALKTPKMGEMIAFRKIFKRIPVSSAVDEATIEPLIRGQGYKAVYVPNAIIHNKGPETVREFIARRRHIYFGHLVTKNEYGYEVATMNGLRIIFLLLKNLPLSFKSLLFTPCVVVLEIVSRILGFLDYKFKLKNHTIWEVTPSTKTLVRSV